MSKKTITLIVVLFLITNVLLYIAFKINPSKKTVEVTPTPTPMSVNAKTTLSLISASASESSKTASQTVAVVVDTTNNVNAVQVELSFDPQKLTNVSVAPGTFFQQPNVLLKNIDMTTGRISYAITEQLDIPGRSGHGTVALISFDLAPSATPATTTIKLLPKSAVTADKILESVLKDTHDITLQLPIGKATPTLIPGNSSSPTPTY